MQTADQSRSSSCEGKLLHVSEGAVAGPRVEGQTSDRWPHLAGFKLDPMHLEQWAGHASTLMEHPGVFDGARPLVRKQSAHVVCVDSGVSDLADAFGNVLGASVTACKRAAEVEAIVPRLPPGSTITVLLLADRLDEQLCHALFEGNLMRLAAGGDRLPYGFLCARSHAHLAWLLAKSLMMLAAMPFGRATFSQRDFIEPASSNHRLLAHGVSEPREIADPLTSQEVAVLGARAHGASFDISFGETVLCGRIGDDRGSVHGPSCFYDGTCFRTHGPGASARQRLSAEEACPLVWCLDSCASVPFKENAFGTGSSYVYGLLAGSAVAVISPYLDIPTRGGMIELVQDRLAAGATLGEATEAACAYDAAEGFDRFLLLGSPDLALLPRSSSATHREPLHEREIGRAADRAWLKNENTGGSSIGPSKGRRAASSDLASRARRIVLNLELLPCYPLAVDPGVIEACRAAAEELEQVAVVGRTSSLATALALARLEVGLDRLHRETAAAFLRRVASEDLSLDRIPAAGFKLGVTRRTRSACPRCRSSLYKTPSEYLRVPGVRRTWLQCANCGGVALTRDDAPFRGSLAARSTGRSSYRFELSLCNRSGTAIDLSLAAAPRRGGPGTLSEPRTRQLAAGEEALEAFDLEGASAGVVSFRVIALCDGAVDLFAARQPVVPEGQQRSRCCG